MIYFCLPFFAWGISGSVKFFVNALRSRSLRGGKRLIGYGGFPSTHTATFSSVVFFVGLRLGFDTPIFTLGLGALLILIMDAHNLRRKVGAQARVINRLQRIVDPEHVEPLRERMGHSFLEIAGGLAVGFCVAYVAQYFC